MYYSPKLCAKELVFRPASMLSGSDPSLQVICGMTNTEIYKYIDIDYYNEDQKKLFQEQVFAEFKEKCDSAFILDDCVKNLIITISTLIFVTATFELLNTGLHF